jgi:hypothetical protein
MSDRRNRIILSFIGLLLAVGGGLSACLGAGVFGDHRSRRFVFDTTFRRWWNEGGWESFAVVGAIGLAIALVGLWLALSQLHRNDGRERTPTVTFPSAEGARGETTLQAPALSHILEADLKAIPDVKGAMVGLFGRYPDIEMRTVLDVGDDIDLDGLAGRVDEVLERMKTTAGVAPDPVQVTVRFKAADRERHLQ